MLLAFLGKDGSDLLDFLHRYGEGNGEGKGVAACLLLSVAARQGR